MRLCYLFVHVIFVHDSFEQMIFKHDSLELMMFVHHSFEHVIFVHGSFEDVVFQHGCFIFEQVSFEHVIFVHVLFLEHVSCCCCSARDLPYGFLCSVCSVKQGNPLPALTYSLCARSRCCTPLLIGALLFLSSTHGIVE